MFIVSLFRLFSGILDLSGIEVLYLVAVFISAIDLAAYAHAPRVESRVQHCLLRGQNCCTFYY